MDMIKKKRNGRTFLLIIITFFGLKFGEELEK
jgi:hypothetical protein